MREEIILEAAGLDAGYGGTPVVRGAEIALRKGEILTLIGPNGSGKSTLLKTLAGQLPPVRGHVTLYGRDLREYRGRELARLMSSLMTERTRPELMTCGEVVGAGRYPYTGMLGILSDHDREVIASSMKAAGVEALADRLFTQISDGQKQRVLLARAICQEPEILIMDEPTSFLDVRHRLDFMRSLLSLVRERGTAAVLSLHEMNLTRKVSDRVICVKDGRAAAAASPEEVFREETVCGLFDLEPGEYRWFYE